MKSGNVFRTRMDEEVFMKFAETCQYGSNIPGFLCNYKRKDRSQVNSVIDYFRSIGLIDGPNRKTKLSEYGEKIYAQLTRKPRSEKKKKKSFF